MKLKYFIYDNGWKEVSFDEYEKFEGTKTQAPSIQRIMLQVIQDMLLPYRFI